MRVKLSGTSALFRDDAADHWLLFENPVHVVKTFSNEEVCSTLDRVEQYVAESGFCAAGFLSYEAAPAFDQSYMVVNGDSFPRLWFGVFESFRVIDKISPSGSRSFDLNWKPELDYQAYLLKLQAISKHIQAGDTYQVNFTFRLRSDNDLDPFLFFESFAACHPPPYAAFINTDSFSICSLSPELFFDLDGSRLISRPMKGTSPRGATCWSDELLARELGSCLKNRAENVMITDMVRNDLGRIADQGTVDVTSLFKVEKFPAVWQMTSAVECRTDAKIQQIMKALFPASSITGAPKTSTMGIIADLEVSPRKIYTGSMGYMLPRRRYRFNVAIRTALFNKSAGLAEFGVGGGIVWDSSPESEWKECWTKAGTLNSASPGFSLLESILWTAEGGCHLLDAHLSRLEESARYFDYCLNLSEVRGCLERTAGSLHSQCKIRLMVHRDGSVDAEPVQLHPLPDPLPLKVCAHPVSASNPFLYHKTTNRKVYEDALSSVCPARDVVLWNEKGEVTETTMANIAVDMNGQLYTPPVKCGLLSGIYRQYLIGAGVLREKVIKVQDLKACDRLYLINSVRGFIRAVIVED